MPSYKNAVVTGATSPIGRAISLALAEHGYSIIVHYQTSAKEAIALCEEVSVKKVRAWAIKANLASGIGPGKLIENSILKAGNISVLINNASAFTSDSFDRITFGDLCADMKINAWAPLYLSRLFAKHASSGAIVNIIDARIPGYDPLHISYSLSKSVLMSITGMCADKFAPHIRVNAVAPGLVRTYGKITSEKLAGKSPLKRLAEPGDIANAVRFLVENQSITGETIFVDCGRRHRGYATL
jgi:NAD(P)-dependent dehydrogenase (short-subunit alcohol dehydrogenase family)